METVKKLVRLSSEVFTLVFLLVGFVYLFRGEEKFYIIDMFLLLGMIFIILLALVLKKGNWFNSKFLNYLFPYLVMILVLGGGVYLVNYLNLSKQLDFKIIGLAYTGFYIAYSLIEYILLRKRRRKLNFK